MNTLTSLDYADLISWTAYNKYGVLLNKTQMQKILFMCYGLYLAQTNNKLFDDDTPKAWPFGPVFPKVNKKFIPGVIPHTFSDDKKNAFLSNQQAFRIVSNTVEKLRNVSARDLSEWSHQEGGPWNKTIYGENGEKTTIQWNQEIKDSLIEEFFNRKQ